MKAVELRTLRWSQRPHLVFVELVSDEGIVGLGETFRGARAVEEHLHEIVAPRLLGQDIFAVQARRAELAGHLGRNSTGVEMRALSCVDIAMWDAIGKALGQPIHRLLGGPVRATLPVYNTCAGPTYNQAVSTAPHPSTWQLGELGRQGEHEDLAAFLHSPGELAKDLLEQGITAMKVWPFDEAAARASGAHAPANALKSGLSILHQIRDAVGSDMELLIEMHGLWDLPGALRIGRALAELDPYWVEDPLAPDLLDELAEFRGITGVPVAASERAGGLQRFVELIRRGQVDYVICDLAWCGGITEARGIIDVAKAYGRPVAFHDCTGPVTLCTSVQAAVSASNVPMQEFARAHYYGWYTEILTQLPPVSGGMIGTPDGPGLGTELQPDFGSRPDVTVRSTR